jgi:hypothetical protein
MREEAHSVSAVPAARLTGLTRTTIRTYAPPAMRSPRGFVALLATRLWSRNNEGNARAMLSKGTRRLVVLAARTYGA